MPQGLQALSSSLYLRFMYPKNVRGSILISELAHRQFIEFMYEVRVLLSGQYLSIKKLIFLVSCLSGDLAGVLYTTQHTQYIVNLKQYSKAC